DIIGAVANKYPTMAGQNLQALMAPQQQLVGQRQASETLEGLLPAGARTFNAPGQLEEMIAIARQNPQLGVELFTNATKALTQSQASTEGGQLAELGPSGQTLRQQSME